MYSCCPWSTKFSVLLHMLALVSSPFLHPDRPEYLSKQIAILQGFRNNPNIIFLILSASPVYAARVGACLYYYIPKS